MKKAIIGLFAGLALLQAGAEELTWQTDVPKAVAQAKAEKKLVMLDFTGSDWCYWCKKLQSEVFSKPEFAAYAKKNLVLVEVDFPHGKKLGEQSAELKKANAELQAKYKADIEGVPTIIVLDAEGKKVGKTGYVEGGPKAWIAEFEKQVKK